MGVTIDIDCPFGYHREFWLGVGMIDCNAFRPPLEGSGSGSLGELVKNHAEFTFIKSLYEEKAGRVSSWGQAVSRCPKCNHLSNKLHYRIEHAGGVYEKGYGCSKCGTAMELLGNGDYDEDEGDEPLDLSGVPCPKCGRPFKDAFGISSMWD